MGFQRDKRGTFSLYERSSSESSNRCPAPSSHLFSCVHVRRLLGVCMYVSTRVCRCMCSCVWRPEVDVRCVLYLSPPYILRQGLSFEPRDDRLASGIPSLPPEHWDYRWTHFACVGILALTRHPRVCFTSNTPISPAFFLPPFLSSFPFLFLFAFFFPLCVFVCFLTKLVPSYWSI